MEARAVALDAVTLDAVTLDPVELDLRLLQGDSYVFRSLDGRCHSSVTSPVTSRRIWPLPITGQSRCLEATRWSAGGAHGEGPLVRR